MKNLTMGLCKNRHSIPVTDYVFPENVNPLDIEGMKETVHNKLKYCNKLELYVTGLTVALIEVINYCCYNHIPLILYHYDRENNTYYPQKVETMVDYDLLVEGGYYK